MKPKLTKQGVRDLGRSDRKPSPEAARLRQCLDEVQYNRRPLPSHNWEWDEFLWERYKEEPRWAWTKPRRDGR